MWNYTEKVREYYRNPKNVGEIEDADAVGEVGSLACGDSMKLTMKIKDGVIEDAKFLTFGCGSAVASASILTELIIGKTVEEAKKVTNKDIAEALGGLPDAKMHCSVLGQEALEEAFKNFEGGNGTAEKETDPIICKCFSVKESTIRQVIQENSLTSIDEVTNYCKAGGGCGLCDKEITRILDEENNAESPKAHKPLSSFSKAQQVIVVNEILEKYVAVELKKDGGGIELVDVTDNKDIHVKLKGACQGCRSSQITLKNFVETTLKDHLGEEIEIWEVTD